MQKKRIFIYYINLAPEDKTKSTKKVEGTKYPMDLEKCQQLTYEEKSGFRISMSFTRIRIRSIREQEERLFMRLLLYTLLTVGVDFASLSGALSIINCSKTFFYP